MSSHHFVKEGQEPALFILDPVSFELASPFLEWAPFVLVYVDALDEVLQWGIKIDAVLRANDIEEATVVKLNTQIPIEIVAAEREQPPINQAFHYLISRKQAGVNVLTARPDAVFAPAEFVSNRLHVNIVDARLKWSGISTGRFEKWVIINSPISIRKSIDSQIIVVHGLTERDGRLESIREGLVSVESNGFFWVAEPHV